MRFFDFLKNKEITKNNTVRLDELASLIQNKKNELSSTESNVGILIKNRISKIINELNTKVLVLQNVNLDNKKVEDRVRLIVKENQEYYIVHVNRLINDINELGQTDLSMLITGINNVFSNFEKRSGMNYQKATFLIGKELENIKESIASFFRDIHEIIKENESIFEKSKIINSLEKKYDELTNINEDKQIIQDNLEEIKKRRIALEKEIQLVEEEKEKIKKSDAHLEEEKSIKDYQEKKNNYRKHIYSLKELIDFKSLASILHSNKKQMEILNDHMDHFQESFEKDNGQALLGLIDIAGSDKKEILERVDQLINKKKELEQNPSSKIINEIKNLENIIPKLRSRINELNEEESRDIKRQEKLEDNLKETIDAIRSELKNIGFELIGFTF